MSLVGGDRTSLEDIVGHIYKQHSREIWIYLLRVGNSEEEAYDLLHSVFLRLIEYMVKNGIFNGEGIRPYLYKMAKNVSIDAGRRRVREQKYLQNLTTEQSVQQEGESKAVLIHNFIHRAMDSDRLSDRQKEILEYRLYDHLDMNEIAEIMEISLRSTYRELNLALQAIRGFILSEGFTQEDFE